MAMCGWLWFPFVLLLLLLQLQGVPPLCGAVRYHGGTVRWEVAPSRDPMTVEVNFYASVAVNGARCDLVQTWSCGYGCPETHFAVGYACVSAVPPRFYSSWGALVPLEAAFTLHIRRDTVTDVRQTSCCWNSDHFEEYGLATPLTDVDFALSTFVDLRTRNDTLQPNNSPKASIAPLVRVNNQCKSKVKIQVSDPDGDAVKCRYARRLECGGGVCGTFPSARLLKRRCEFEFFGELSDRLPKRFGVTVVVEDFATAPLEMMGTLRTPADALSSVTLQFTVQVGSSDDCVRLVFVSPTPEPHGLVKSHAGVALELPVVVMADGGSMRLAPELVVVSGGGVTASLALPVPDVAGTYRATLNVEPSLLNAADLRWTCFYAQSSEGWQSELRCVSIIVAARHMPGHLHGLRAAPGGPLRPLGFISSVQRSGAVELSVIFSQQFVLATAVASIRLHLAETGALVYAIDASDARLVTRQPGPGFALTARVPAGALGGAGPLCLQLDAGVVQDALTVPGILLDSSPHDACDWILPAVPAVRGVVEVSCTHERMSAAIPRAAILGYNASSLRLNSQAPGCGLHDGQRAVTFDVSLGSCGTVLEETATDLVFTQMVTLASSTSYLVTYDYVYVLVNCTCKIPRTKLLSLGPLRPVVSSAVLNQTAFSALDLRMDVWADSQPASALRPEPLRVRPGAPLLLQVSARGGLNVTVLTLDCYATPASSPQDPVKYYLIRDGCLLADVTNLTTVATRRRFRFKAFGFRTSPGSDVYIHCAVVVCKRSASSSRCYQGCVPRRANRSPALTGDAPVYLVSRGPVFVDDEASSGASGAPLLPGLSALAVLAVAALGFLVLGLVLRFPSCTKCRDPHAR